MQVILRDKIENLGNAGDVVDVRPGYGRNYLIPKGLAYEATQANVRRHEAERAAQGRRDEETLGEARKRAAAIEGVSLTFHARAGQEG
ncbi:MAG TPA: 50S ribosomal protein L9, partial [Longimicrobium sp.]|nr:50S ribosomal protein L9 [Longimicrobium sp.]